MSQSPWNNIGNWTPFRIDALGLISLLGAPEVDTRIGSLQIRRLTEWLPLLASFVVCSDDFCKEQSGYSLHNLTDGIHTTELKGWFVRWLSMQRISSGTTVFRWRVEANSRAQLTRELSSMMVALVVITPMIFSTVLLGDWFGLTNALSIVLSVLVRKIMVSQRRSALHRAMQSIQLPSKVMQQSEDPEQRLQESSVVHWNTMQSDADILTLLVTRKDGKLVTMFTPRSVLNTMVKGVKLERPILYQAAKWTGWAAFGVHIVMIGMSSLLAQLYAVVMLVSATWLYCHTLSVDIPHTKVTACAADGTTSCFTTLMVTTQLQVEQESPSTASDTGGYKGLPDKRLSAYVRLQLTDKQEAMMRHWSLLPFDAMPWYAEYQRAKDQYKQSVLMAAESRKNMGYHATERPLTTE